MSGGRIILVFSDGPGKLEWIEAEENREEGGTWKGAGSEPSAGKTSWKALHQ